MRPRVLLIALLMTSAAQAAPDRPKPDSPKPDAVPSDPQTTTAAFGDWVERCQRLAGPDARRVCEVVLTVAAAGQNAPLAEVALGRLKKGDPLRLTLVLPVNVSFPGGPKLTLDGGAPWDLGWRHCVPAGCFADAALDADQQKALREAKSAKVDSKAASGQAFNFAVSLRGLPQALDAMAREP